MNKLHTMSYKEAKMFLKNIEEEIAEKVFENSPLKKGMQVVNKIIGLPENIEMKDVRKYLKAKKYLLYEDADEWGLISLDKDEATVFLTKEGGREAPIRSGHVTLDNWHV